MALTEFDALAGFRDVDETKEIFRELDIEELARYVDLLNTSDDAEALRALFTTWLTLPQNVLDQLVAAVAAGCAAYAGKSDQARLVAETTELLANRYPGDPGVLGSMLLNRLRIQPGEALYLGAGQLHAYLNGMGVEIMANSDNVLRGGLTKKHVDVVELLRVLQFTPLDSPVVRPSADAAGWNVYSTPAQEFELSSKNLRAGEEIRLSADTAAIVLVTEGSVTISAPDAETESVVAAQDSAAGSSLTLTRGTATWVAADQAAAVSVIGGPNSGGTIFTASVPRPRR